MKSNLPQAIQHLLSCGDINDRLSQSRKIIAHLNDSVGNFGNVESTLRTNFIDRIKASAIYPGNNQFVLYKLADFYDQNYLYQPDDVVAA